MIVSTHNNFIHTFSISISIKHDVLNANNLRLVEFTFSFSPQYVRLTEWRVMIQTVLASLHLAYLP